MAYVFLRWTSQTFPLAALSTLAPMMSDSDPGLRSRWQHSMAGKLSAVCRLEAPGSTWYTSQGADTKIIVIIDWDKFGPKNHQDISRAFKKHQWWIKDHQKPSVYPVYPTQSWKPPRQELAMGFMLEKSSRTITDRTLAGFSCVPLSIKHSYGKWPVYRCSAYQK